MLRFAPRMARILPRMVVIPSLPVKPISMTMCSVRSYSTSMDLAQVLKKEIEYELAENKAEETAPEFSAKEWTIEDIEGSNQVKLSRTFGKESITVLFSVNDMIVDEEDVEAEVTVNENGEEEELLANVRPTVTVILTKPGKNAGALEITGEPFGESWVFNTIKTIPTAELALSDSLEADFKRSDLYSGPVLEDLEADVQDKFYEFMEERGFTNEFAAFVAQYAERKEQAEYTNWLAKFEGFIRA